MESLTHEIPAERRTGVGTRTVAAVAAVVAVAALVAGYAAGQRGGETAEPVTVYVGGAASNWDATTREALVLKNRATSARPDVRMARVER